MTPRLIHGDCLEAMRDIADGSVDMVCTDPPYGTTACKWDSMIPFEQMWAQLNRILKPNGAIVLTASQPFTSALIMSNVPMFKYEWMWQKSKAANFTHAKNMPIKFHENILVFSAAPIGHYVQLGERRMKYNPQGLRKVNKKWSRPKKYETEHGLSRESHSLERVIEFEGYPKSLLEFSNSDNRERGLHPTQKPVTLMEYLIRTYTDAGETVLDFTMGSGTTGVACKNLGRSFIGIELDEDYFKIARERINGTPEPE